MINHWGKYEFAKKYAKTEVSQAPQKQKKSETRLLMVPKHVPKGLFFLIIFSACLCISIFS